MVERWAINMRTLSTILFLIAFTAGSWAQDKDSLRLDVYPVAPSEDAKAGRLLLEVHSIITNVSQRAITLPTTTYDGHAELDFTAGDRISFGIAVGFNSNGKNTLVPSPFRFNPVTLQPGEATELPLIECKSVETWRLVVVNYTVDEEYARKHGWWYGHLKTEAVVGKGDNPYIVPPELPRNGSTFKNSPNKAPLQTPATGTSAAGAPVVPPVGAAGR